MVKEYDVVIIGGGPAGLTAGIYCGRSGLETVVLEKIAIGGHPLMYGEGLENYPGFQEGISGFELMERMKKQAEKFRVEFQMTEIADINPQTSHNNYQVLAKTGEKYYTKAVIIETGANPKRLGIEGETELLGKGVSYCATCDGPLFKGKDIVVIGGGDTAVGEAVYLTKFVRKLVLVHRRDSLRATKILQDRLMNDKKVEARWNCVATRILGSDRVNGVRIKDVKTNKEDEILASGVFIFVGLEPHTDFLKGKIELDDNGFIITNEEMATSWRGVFACGDVRKNIFKQVITSCAEGAQAAHSCYRYIETLLKG